MARRHDHDAGGDPEVLAAKAALRDEVWSSLTDAGVARFPGARNRISNFVGAEAAAQRLRELPEWAAAQRVKSNPDSAQLPVRQRALEDGKTVYMAVPRLAEEDPSSCSTPTTSPTRRGAPSPSRTRCARPAASPSPTWSRWTSWSPGAWRSARTAPGWARAAGSPTWSSRWRAPRD
ncbi:hypothetical protein ACFQV8_14660 [Pseudonocardia benzenivorans]